MIVKILTNLGSAEFPDHRYLEGEEHEVSEKFGGMLVKRKLAVDITPPSVVGVATEPELKAVPAESELKAVPEASQPPAKPVASAKLKKNGD